MTEPMLPTPVRVTGKRRESADTVSLVLESRAGTTPGAPGQFNMLYAFGVGEVPISIAGLPRRGGVMHTVRAVGAVTRALAALRRGDVVGVRGPFGVGWPLERAAGRDLVLVAGGIGLAPLRPVVEAVLRERSRYGRVAVVHGARSPGARVFRREVERWRRGDLRVELTVDAGAPGWDGHVGFVTDRLPHLRIDPARAVAFVCGPEVMMRASAVALAEVGLGPDEVFISAERNMKCATGICGHCQLAETLICRDGPVLPYTAIGRAMATRER